jgi:hypothetical protein
MTKKKTTEVPAEQNVEAITVKIVQSVRPGDVIFIECEKDRTTQQLQHLHEQIKSKLPDVRIVILNKGARVTAAQTAATVTPQ